MLQGIPQLSRFVGRVDVDQDDADACGRVLDDDPFGSVRRPDADAVALLDAPREQAARGAGGLFPQLSVRRAVVLLAHHQRFTLRDAFDGAAQVLADRLAEQRDGARSVDVRRCWHTVDSSCRVLDAL